MKKVKTLKVISTIFFLFLFVGIGMLVGLKFKAFETKEVITTPKQIAVVNMDMGVEYNGGYINYGKEISKTFSENYVLVNLETAKQGITNGQYSAYITFVGDFSKNIISINETPKKTEMYYEVSQTLTSDEEVEVTKEILLLQQQINDRVSYLYINSILDEYSLAKNQVKDVMANDKKDFDSIMKITDNDLITLINLTELEKLGIDIQNLDMSKSFEENVQIANQFNEKYVEIMGLTQEQLISLKTNQTLPNSEGEINKSLTETTNIIDSIFPDKDSTNPDDVFTNIHKNIGGITEIVKNINKDTLFENINTYITEVGTNTNKINDYIKKQELDRILNQNQIFLLEYSVLVEYFKMTYIHYLGDGVIRQDLIDSFKDKDFNELGIGATTSTQYVNKIFTRGFIDTRKNYYTTYQNDLKTQLDNMYNNIITQTGNINTTITATNTELNGIKIHLDSEILKAQEHITTLNTEITNLNNTLVLRDREIGFYKNNNEEIRKIINPLNDTASNLDEYKQQIDKYNPLLPYDEKSKEFEKLYKEYVKNNSEIQNTFNKENDKNIEFVRKTYDKYDEHIEQIRKDILLYDEESNNKLSQSLQSLKNIKEQTSQSNINMMNDFSNRLPYIDVNTLKNKEIQTFIATPINLIETVTDNTSKQENKNNIDNILVLVLCIITLICIILLIVTSIVKNKAKKQSNASLEEKF